LAYCGVAFVVGALHASMMSDSRGATCGDEIGRTVSSRRRALIDTEVDSGLSIVVALSDTDVRCHILLDVTAYVTRTQRS
jgi:hypothetical protein